MRAAMVASQLRTNGVTDTRLLAAMAAVPREAFVPQHRRAACYADRPVPLSATRALNPPMTTARLLDALALREGDRLLIVGAASGYSVAVAKMLCRTVVALEDDGDLIDSAYRADIETGPLAAGVPDQAPFDAILIEGAVEQLPDALFAQLVPEGRLATGLVRDGVTRLATGRRGGSSFALADFADAEVVVLP